MIRIFISLLLALGLSAKTITPNDVYSQSILIQNHLHFLLKHYNVEHRHEKIKKNANFSIKLKPRHSWQKSYEILVKINMMRALNDLPRIEPVGIVAVENLNPDMVYEQTQRILTEIKIFENRKDMIVPEFKIITYSNKTPLDVYNAFTDISMSFDELNYSELSPSYVFAETMRIYDDLTIVLNHLRIKDDSVPTKRLKSATPKDSLKVSLKVLDKIKTLQRMAGINAIDMSEFKRDEVLPSDVYSITGVILAELQTLKAYIGLNNDVTTPALHYVAKVPADIEQLMQWNLKKLLLINNLRRR